MKLAIILSNDWELFGDGSGDYFEIQHRPLEAFLSVAGDHGAKLTLMAELGQQWAHQEIADGNSWAGEIADAWEQIVRDTVARGMDVQFHLHPQWLRYRRDSTRWHLDLERMHTSSLAPAELDVVLTRGKTYLERLLRPVDRDYECVAFRAGAYLIEPAAEVLRALERCRFLCDTSVTRGLVDQGYDYRRAHSTSVPWIPDFANICRPARNGGRILEMPLCAGRVHGFPRLRYMLRRDLPGTTPDESAWFARQRQRGGALYPQTNRAHGRLRRIRTTDARRSAVFARSLVAWRGYVQLDYDRVPAAVFCSILEQAKRAAGRLRPEPEIVPIVASGHVKSVSDAAQFARILDSVERRFRGEIEYWNLRDAARYWWSRLVTDAGRARCSTEAAGASGR